MSRRARTFAPSVDILEGRQLLNGATWEFPAPKIPVQTVFDPRFSTWAQTAMFVAPKTGTYAFNFSIKATVADDPVYGYLASYWVGVNGAEFIQYKGDYGFGQGQVTDVTQNIQSDVSTWPNGTVVGYQGREVNLNGGEYYVLEWVPNRTLSSVDFAVSNVSLIDRTPQEITLQKSINHDLVGGEGLLQSATFTVPTSGVYRMDFSVVSTVPDNPIYGYYASYQLYVTGPDFNNHSGVGIGYGNVSDIPLNVRSNVALNDGSGPHSDFFKPSYNPYDGPDPGEVYLSAGTVYTLYLVQGNQLPGLTYDIGVTNIKFVRIA